MMLKLESQIGVRIDKKLDEPIEAPSRNFLPPRIDGLLPPMLDEKLRIPPNDFVNPPATQRNPNSIPNREKPTEPSTTEKTPETIETTEKIVEITPRSTVTTPETTKTIQTTEAVTAISSSTTDTPRQIEETDEPLSDPIRSTPSLPKSTAQLQTRPTASSLTRIPVPFDSVLRMMSPPSSSEGDTCKNACCVADENTPKIVLPISMKHLGKQHDGCESFAKLVIPIDGLSPADLRALASVSVNELVKKVLESLS